MRIRADAGRVIRNGGLFEVRLTEKQALVLLDIAKWAICIRGGVAGYSSETILTVVHQIVNQQSDKLIELDEK